MNIVWKGCSAGNFRPGRPPGFRPSAIVIHIAEGTLDSVDHWFNNAIAKVSAHYCVGRGGEIHQFVHEEDTAYHAGNAVTPSWKLLRPGVNPNFYTIGIEHEGRAQDQWTEAQYNASAELVGEIAERWSIPLDQDHVVMHREIRASKTCPGFVFDRNTLLARIPPPPVPGPASDTVTLITQANVREERPDRSASIRAVLDSGTKIPIDGVVVGEMVSGNAAWYRLQAGGFVWAGATDVPIPAT